MAEAEASPIFDFFMEYAYEPLYVYGGAFVLLTASSFGLPVPEEATLLSVGLLAHIGSHPELYPPPTPDAQGINMVFAAVFCTFAVFISDLTVFMLGRKFGPRLRNSAPMQRFIKPAMWDRIDRWTTKYGAWACGIFRFTPGLRFPGHFTCGSLGISYAKFIAVDGGAVLLTVPIQIVLMALYGQQVVAHLKSFKLVVGTLLAIAVVVVLLKKWRQRRNARRQASEALAGVGAAATAATARPSEPGAAS